MSSSSSDPRRPDNIVPFFIPKRKEVEESYAHMTAMLLSMASIMTRNKYKLFPWVAAFFGISATLNTRKTMQPKDPMASNGAFLAIIALGSYYINLYFAHAKTMAAVASGEITVVDSL
ncbi:hypothetical protein BDB01DRAFT_815675 [Pilobolus umbonatus]|nr:hypothetical protein BDB01DRAFT_815675 [Pilobolus umbonatus]